MSMNLLIVKPSSMGDVIHTLPAAQALKRAHPDGRLGWVVEQAHAPLLARQPFLDEVIVWERSQWRTWGSFAKKLRQGGWNLAIDFQGLWRSGFITWLSGAKRRIGYAPSRELAHWFYTDRVHLATMDRHAVDRNLDLAAVAGAVWPGLPKVRPYLSGMPPVSSQPAGPELFPLFPSEADHVAVEGWLARHEFQPGSHRLVVFNPHCRKPANCWPPDHFTELARRLLDLPNFCVALSGGPGTQALCDRITSPLGEKVWRADGQFGLLATAALLKHAAAVITGDTGPMHIAVAVGAPVVALFGPANPLRTGPYASDAFVLNKYIECSPCFGRNCPLRYDPPKCMAAITPEEVYHTVLKVVERENLL